MYTTERNTQILISLLKAHGIKKVIASPGATNVSFIASIQNDAFFEIYSSVDERSAAYIACGLAAESGEAVALSCTGATASRNYTSGLTEAYYRKLPILAITSTMPLGRIGHNIPQVIDRTSPLNDIAKLSVLVPEVHDDEDEWICTVNVNKALLELNHHGCGPVHINLVTRQSGEFNVKEIENVNVIDRIINNDKVIDINNKKVGIFVGAHKKWSDRLTELVDTFCENYNGVVLCDQTSNYKGKYKVMASLITSQKQYYADCRNVDILIHLGDISGAYLTLNPSEVWRVNPDGEIRDTFRKLRYVFECSEEDFFEKYNNLRKKGTDKKTDYYNSWHNEYININNNIPELPFSNIWISQQMSKLLPQNSIIHLGILNSLRSWNFFETPDTVLGYSNTGGFGIDGCISSLLGASLAKPDTIFYGAIGDLAFFYDMNALGNRHLSKNIRLLVVNNGHGQEFRNYAHRAEQFGEDTDTFIAAAGHYGQKSKVLVKHYAEDLGFEYLSSINKEEFKSASQRFLTPEITQKPILFECFTDCQDESDALKSIYNISKDNLLLAKNTAKKLLGADGIRKIKKILKG